MPLQLDHYLPKLFELQQTYGDQTLMPIHGAGALNQPHICFIFMNPTARNISATQEWEGIRAPWLGTKHIWKMFNKINLLSNSLLHEIQEMQSRDWDAQFSTQLYTHIAQQGVYITNFAKCTQLDARGLPNSVFRAYQQLLFNEIQEVRPKKVITFGTQVSTLFLQKQIKISDYTADSFETITIGELQIPVYPTYYPVGQGMRNMPLVISRMNAIVNSHLQTSPTALLPTREE